MAEYPDGVYAPRTKENEADVIYDADKPTINYMEDIVFLDDEVVAIETELGDNPKGDFGDVAERLDAIEDATVMGTKITADSVNITVGGTDASSVVANLQTENDGNIFHLDEVAGTPGIDMYVEFIDVVMFNMVSVKANYVGSGTHALGILLYDWVAGAWKSKHCMQNSVYNTTPEEEVICNSSFRVPIDDNFVGTGDDEGKVRIRIVHPMAGNASHDIYINEVALYN